MNSVLRRGRVLPLVVVKCRQDLFLTDEEERMLVLRGTVTQHRRARHRLTTRPFTLVLPRCSSSSRSLLPPSAELNMEIWPRQTWRFGLDEQVHKSWESDTDSKIVSNQRPTMFSFNHNHKCTWILFLT